MKLAQEMRMAARLARLIREGTRVNWLATRAGHTHASLEQWRRWIREEGLEGVCYNTGPVCNEAEEEASL